MYELLKNRGIKCIDIKGMIIDHLQWMYYVCDGGSVNYVNLAQ